MESGPFGKLMPGLDMLKNWMSSAGSSMPAMGAWMAPTLDPQELGKRIEELRTVQYWLEQNARLLATTIQTLEVQRMTLTTLHKMNVPMPDLGEAFKMPVPETPPPPAAARSAPAAEPQEDSDDEPDDPAAASQAAGSPSQAEPGAAAPGLVDPMQWWGALTQQFTEIAGRAVQEGAAAAGAVAEAARTQAAGAGGAASAKTRRTPAAKAASKAAAKAPGAGRASTKAAPAPGARPRRSTPR